MKKTKPKPAAQPKPPKPFFRPFEAVARELAKPAPEGTKAPAPKVAPAPPRAAPAAAPPADVSFAELVWGVTKTDRGPRAEPQLAKNVPTPKEAKRHEDDDAAPVREHLRSLVQGGDARFETTDDGLRIEGRRIDTDPKVVRRLRRGEISVDVTVDLHGLGVHEARARIEELVPKCAGRGERMLLVVHGKGRHSPAGVGVLRGEMAAWLSQGPASVHVAAFTSALPDDGGDGALYVLLRR